MSTTTSGLSSGSSTVDWLTAKWLQYQGIKNGVDLQSSGQDNNVNSRTDAASGQTSQGGGQVATKPTPWALIGLGVAGVLGVALLMKR